MEKRNRIIYWIATVWLSLGMLVSGVIQLIQQEEETKVMAHLGYPVYFESILGAWKILGVIAVLLPGFRVVKEWAYAGFFIAMTGAIVSHFVARDGAAEFFGPTLLTVLTITSWYFRPASRKVAELNK